QHAAIFDRLVVEVHLLQCLETAALVHEGAVVRSDVVCRITRVNASACEKIERRHTGSAANFAASRCAAPDVLTVALFVVIICGVSALSREKRLHALLSPYY